MDVIDLPFLDFDDPAFSTRSNQVSDARRVGWAARTPYGLAVLRYREAGQILRDRRFRQGSHGWPASQGLTGPFADFWSASVIGQEGDHHRALRAIADPALSPDRIATMRPAFAAIADDLASALRCSDRAEFQSQFAFPFAGQAIATLLGLPAQDWKPLAQDAAALGLAMGVQAKSHEREINAACTRLQDLARDLVARARAGKSPDGFVANMVARFDATADLDPQDLVNLIVIAVFGGVDTTTAQLGLGLALFIEHPDQWRALRAEPALIPQAIDEIQRTRPTTTWVTREALEDVDIEGLFVPRGTVLHLLVNATARDPANGDDGRFDITRRAKRHFGFGGGAHHCMGHLIARTDMTEAWTALVSTFETIAADGPALFHPDSGNTGPIRLPIRYTIPSLDGAPSAPR